MTSPVATLVWELYARQRWLIRTTGVLVALLPLFALHPPLLRANAVATAVSVTLVVALLLIFANLSHGFDGRLEDGASLFPRRYFSLPVSEWALVAPPMLATSGLLIGTWLFLSLAVLRPCGVAAPVLWPGLVTAAAAAWLQALMWMPFPLPYLRAVLLVVIAVAAFNTALFTPAVPRGAAEAAFLLLTLIAYPVAHHGVYLARRGWGVAEPMPAVDSLSPARPLRPFASPLDAQGWLEWRQLRLGVIIGALTCLWIIPVLVLIPVALDRLQLDRIDLKQLEREPAAIRGLIGGLITTLEAYGRGWFIMAPVLLVPLIAAMGGGADVGRLGLRRDTRELPSFLATKPIDNATVLGAKLWVAARAWALLWAATLLFMLVWAGARGYLPEMAERASRHFGSPLLAAVALTGGAVGLAAVSWLWHVRGLWAGLWGSVWAMVSLPITGVGFVGALVGGVPWLAALWVLVDGAMMSPLLLRSRYGGLIAMLHVASITSVLLGWWPVAVLLWPCAGLLAAPVAIDRNRHR